MKHWHRARESPEFAFQLHGSNVIESVRGRPRQRKKKVLFQEETKKKVPGREENKEENEKKGREQKGSRINHVAGEEQIKDKD